MICFEIPGKPQGKARARTFYNYKLRKLPSLTPENTILYENLIKHWHVETNSEQCKGKEPLKVEITAYFPIPKRATKRDRELIELLQYYPTKKPDADNIAKVVCDALNGLAYTDDTQVVDLTVHKRFGEPKVIVKIWGMVE